MTRKMACVTACVFIAFTLSACRDRERGEARPSGDRSGDPAAGLAIAQRSCHACHRPDGTGTAPGIPRLGGQDAAYLAHSIRDYAAGARRHAVLKDMTPQLGDADILNVAAYYASLPEPPAAAVTPVQGPTPYERGKASAAACAGCHGTDGNSATAGTPSLAGQQPIYLLAALTEYHRGDRSTPDLQAMLRRADAVELESLALFYAAQTPSTRSTQTVGDPVAGETVALRCTGCHGFRGVSDDAATPMLAGQDPVYLVKALGNYGKSRHHASMERQLGPLGDKEVRDLAAYFSTQKGRASQPAQDIVAQLSDKCDRCHGSAAGQPAAPVPRIRGQDKDYLVMALRAYRDDRRASSTMHKMSLPFSEAAIEGLAAHYARQPGQ